VQKHLKPMEYLGMPWVVSWLQSASSGMGEVIIMISFEEYKKETQAVENKDSAKEIIKEILCVLL
jgi:hypothetical protein